MAPPPVPAAAALPTAELAVAFVGDADRLVAWLREDLAGRWPMVERLPGPPASPLVPDAVRPDAAWHLLSSVAGPRDGVVPRLLSLADRFGVLVDVLLPLDAVLDVEGGWLDAELAAWAGVPAGLRQGVLEQLAGPAAVAGCLERLRDPGLGQAVRSAAASALGHAVANTPDGRGLHLALDVAEELAAGNEVDRRLAGQVLTALRPAGDLVAHLALPSPGEEALARLASDAGWRARGAALELLRRLPGQRQPATVEVLLALAEHGRWQPHDQVLPGVVRAVDCLAAAPATPDVVSLLAELSAASPTAEVRRRAAVALVELLGDGARDSWVALMASTDVADVVAGEGLLARIGTEADLPLAVQATRRLLRRGDADEPRRHPPRGAGLLSFLAAHRGRVEVDAVFVEVAARWERLPGPLRAWAAEHLPWLGPLR